MGFAERVLDHAEFAGRGREALDGRDLVTIRLHGEHQAGSHGLAIDKDRTGAAHAERNLKAAPLIVKRHLRCGGDKREIRAPCADLKKTDADALVRPDRKTDRADALALPD